jgi:hypothetical protein
MRSIGARSISILFVPDCANFRRIIRIPLRTLDSHSMRRHSG